MNAVPMDDAARWAAVVRRDAAAEGTFVYAVATTGVFCRPGCSARLPRRGNVAFFESCGAAQDAGYRPCRRCRPDAPSRRALQAAALVGACRRLETEERPPTLRALAEAAGMSPWHFHRLFRAGVGVTPRQYAAAHRLQRFSAALRSAGSVTEAVYAAGFGAPSRATEAAQGWLRMTPSAIRAGAKGSVLRYGTGRSSLGQVVVAATERGVCAIEFVDRAEEAVARLRARFPGARFERGDAAFSARLREAISWVEDPGGPEVAFPLPLDIRGTAFQRRVWQALREIPHGQTRSYAAVAEGLGRPAAARGGTGLCLESSCGGHSLPPCGAPRWSSGRLPLGRSAQAGPARPRARARDRRAQSPGGCSVNRG